MPEGPEITFFSIFMSRKFVGGKIILKDNINVPDNLDGTIIEISNKGKLLWFKLKSKNCEENYYLHLHLGISGWIVFKDAKYVKYNFIIKKSGNEYNVFIEDKIRLSNMSIYDEKEHNKIIGSLGIDIFSEYFTKENFISKIKCKKMILSSFLLKQDLFSGIGNYIKNEVLYLGNLDIKIKTNELTDEQIEELYNNILFVGYSNLVEQLMIVNMNDNIPKEKKLNLPNNLEIPYKYKIYRRKTTDDGNEVKMIKVGGRDTYYVKK